MLVCATLFWAGNFMVGKFAFLENIPPMSLVFYQMVTSMDNFITFYLQTNYKDIKI